MNDIPLTVVGNTVNDVDSYAIVYYSINHDKSPFKWFTSIVAWHTCWHATQPVSR